MNFTNAIAQLQEEGYAGFAGVPLEKFWHNGNLAATYADLRVVDERDNSVITPSEQDLIDAESRWLAEDATLQAETAAKQVTKADILAYLRTQMFSATPDSLNTIYTTVSAFVNSNTKVQNAVNNILGLLETEDGVVIDLGTNAGKARYLRAVLDMLPFAD